MKYKINPGEIIDVLAPHEMQEHTDRLLAALGKNAIFRKLGDSVLTDAGSLFRKGIGPKTGFMWDIRWISIDLGNTTGVASVYFGENTLPINKLANITSQAPPTIFPQGSFILQGGEQLFFTNGSAAATASFLASFLIAVVEVPKAHEAQLLG